MSTFIVDRSIDFLKNFDKKHKRQKEGFSMRIQIFEKLDEIEMKNMKGSTTFRGNQILNGI